MKQMKKPECGLKKSLSFEPPAETRIPQSESWAYNPSRRSNLAVVRFSYPFIESFLRRASVFARPHPKGDPSDVPAKFLRSVWRAH
jgi:hypothetical protein